MCYLSDGVIVVHKLIRTADDYDVINSTRQVSTTRVVNVEVQRPQNSRLAAVTRCLQTTLISAY